MEFVEAILPLGVQGTFTYSVPEDLRSRIQRGCRVLVQFGRRKFYTAIVADIHHEEPKGYDVKPLLDILDEEPILRYPQMKLWEWVADYYLCNIGDVYRAAIPSGLKIESETFVSLAEDVDDYDSEAEHIKLSAEHEMILSMLKNKPKMRIGELDNALHIKNINGKVAYLLSKGLVEVAEGKVDKYRSKKEKVVTLPIAPGDEEGLSRMFDLVKRSPVQERALISYLTLSQWMNPKGDVKREVPKKLLLEKAGTTSAIITAMLRKGIFTEKTNLINRFAPDANQSGKDNLAQLSPTQTDALREIHQQFKEKDVVLLHGMTGSGKTEIYTHLISKVLAAKQQVLYLVPEIALTTQLTDRLMKVFGNKVIVYHSKFTDSERVDIYRRLLMDPDPLLIIGVRSSVFLPFRNLGLVIVDEEHESSYKQAEPAPRYNARDTAMVLARMHGCKTLLGSATPSIETYYKALSGKFGLVKLNQRFSEVELPTVSIVDMKEQKRAKEARGVLSKPLRESIDRNLKMDKQVILFQNRRGFSPTVVCESCGWTPKCINCDVGMVYHKHSNQLRCHYCGHSYPLTPLCPACGQPGIRTYGYGTERIAENTEEEFADAEIKRMDLDTTRNRNSYQNIIESFASHETDILVGTQMISKGLDFENVQLVGIVNADTILNFPDFRSAERAFNMLEQVGGRAGRRKERGEVIIQTYDPDQPLLKHLVSHDYEAYYREEIREREKYGYPPFTKIVNVVLKHPDRGIAYELAAMLTKLLRNVFGTRVLGPEEPAVKRVYRQYIQHMMLKVEAGASMAKVKQLLRGIYAEALKHPLMRQATIYYDVDPV